MGVSSSVGAHTEVSGHTHTLMQQTLTTTDGKFSSLWRNIKDQVTSESGSVENAAQFCGALSRSTARHSTTIGSYKPDRSVARKSRELPGSSRWSEFRLVPEGLLCREQSGVGGWHLIVTAELDRLWISKPKPRTQSEDASDSDAMSTRHSRTSSHADAGYDAAEAQPVGMSAAAQQAKLMATSSAHKVFSVAVDPLSNAREHPLSIMKSAAHKEEYARKTWRKATPPEDAAVMDVATSPTCSASAFLCKYHNEYGDRCQRTFLTKTGLLKHEARSEQKRQSGSGDGDCKFRVPAAVDQATRVALKNGVVAKESAVKPRATVISTALHTQAAQPQSQARGAQAGAGRKPKRKRTPSTSAQALVVCALYQIGEKDKNSKISPEQARKFMKETKDSSGRHAFGYETKNGPALQQNTLRGSFSGAKLKKSNSGDPATFYLQALPKEDVCALHRRKCGNQHGERDGKRRRLSKKEMCKQIRHELQVKLDEAGVSSITSMEEVQQLLTVMEEYTAGPEPAAVATAVAATAVAATAVAAPQAPPPRRPGVPVAGDSDSDSEPDPDSSWGSDVSDSFWDSLPAGATPEAVAASLNLTGFGDAACPSIQGSRRKSSRPRIPKRKW